MAGTWSGAGCRDKQGKFVPVSQCTRRRPKAKGQKPLGGTTVKMKKGETICKKGRLLHRFKGGKKDGRVNFIKGRCRGSGRKFTRIKAR